MNIGEVKTQIMNLAFEEESSMEEYTGIVLDALNRAIHMIHATVRPILGCVEIEQDGTAKGPIRYDMKELTKEDGVFVWMDFADQIEYIDPEGTYHNTWSRGYSTANRTFLILDGRIAGRFIIWFKRIPKKILAETEAETELELDYDVQPLLPLLAAHYVWLDDDERKADRYWNQYDDLKNQILENSRRMPQVNMEGGFAW